VGDPLEVSAIGKVFASEREGKPPLLIGSIKSNLGHPEAASGMAGIIKSVLALEKGIIPATIGVQNPNPSSK
jgi:acyl transferase domain-containing protein